MSPLLCLFFTSGRNMCRICHVKSLISLLMFYLLLNFYTCSSSLLFHCSFSFFSISFSTMSLPQLMFPGFLSDSLQQWVQCAHSRKHKRRYEYGKHIHPDSCLHVHLQHTHNFIIHARYRPASYKLPIHVPFFPLTCPFSFSCFQNFHTLIIQNATNNILFSIIHFFEFVWKAGEDIYKDDILNFILTHPSGIKRKFMDFVITRNESFLKIISF